MSDLTRAIRRDKSGLLGAVVKLFRDFIVAQLLGGHSRQDTDNLIERANALAAWADEDGDGIPNALDATPRGEVPNATVQPASSLAEVAASPATSLVEKMRSVQAELDALPQEERAAVLAALFPHANAE